MNFKYSLQKCYQPLRIDPLEFNRHKLLFVSVFGKGVMSTNYVTGTLNNSLSTLK